MTGWINPILASANPVGHVTDKPLYGQWYVSNVTVMLFASMIVTMLVVIPAARKIASGPGKTTEDVRAKGAWANFVEAVCLYLRDQIFRPLLGEQTDRFMPMLWTFFWFILICNLMGLLPLLDLTAMFGLNPAPDSSYEACRLALELDPENAELLNDLKDLEAERTIYGIGGTATQSIWVTGALATVAFLYWNINGLIKDPIGFFRHFTQGAPFYIWPIIIVVEILGLFIKPFALALRLFANMTGGHVLLAALFGFVYSLILSFGTIGLGIGLIPLLGAVAIFMLEILVAFLQAFIFTFLTGLFLSQLVVHHGGEQTHDEHATEIAH